MYFRLHRVFVTLCCVLVPVSRGYSSLQRVGFSFAAASLIAELGLQAQASVLEPVAQSRCMSLVALQNVGLIPA